MASKRHELRTWPGQFEDIRTGAKTFELRKNDRGFREGDILTLREWEPAALKYTGRRLSVRVRYILDNAEEWALMGGFCVMGIRKLKG